MATTAERLKQIDEESQAIYRTLRGLQEKADAEKRSMSAEEDGQFTELGDKIDALEEERSKLIASEDRAAERRSRLDKIDAALKQSRGRQVPPAQPHEQRSRREIGGDGDAHGDAYQFLSPRLRDELEYRSSNGYRRQMLRYLLENSVSGDLPELRVMQSSLDGSGGAWVAPMVMADRVIKAMDDLTFMRRLATVDRLTGSLSLGFPVLTSDPSDAEWTSEVATITESTGLGTGRRVLRPNPLKKLVKASLNWLRNSSLPADMWIADRLAYKFAITQEKAFLTGDGRDKPLGVFTASEDGISTARDVSTDNTTTAITADGLINALFALKQQYQANAAWIFHRDAVKRIRKLKYSSSNEYIWVNGLGGTPATILDRPYYMSEYAPSTFTAGLYVGLIGDFRAGYTIVDSLDLGVQRLNELYATAGQVGFLGTLETDGAPVLAEAFARVTLAAS